MMGPAAILALTLGPIVNGMRAFSFFQNYVKPLRGVTGRQFSNYDAGSNAYISLLDEEFRDEKIKYMVKYGIK